VKIWWFEVSLLKLDTRDKLDAYILYKMQERRKKMKKMIFILLMLLCTSFAFGQIHSWNSGEVKYELGDGFTLAGNGELRLTGPGLYYSHIHFDLDYKLSDHFTIGVSERESYLLEKGVTEHKPMLNLKAKFGALSNRARITWRIKEGENVIRFRNKTTVTYKDAFIAYELFLEEGRVGRFRSRYYMGFELAEGLSIFILHQVTEGTGIWVIGTSWGVEL